MTIRVTKFEQTPNPLAIKATLSTAITEQRRAYRGSEAVGDDELARAIFELPGVIGVLILSDFITISKTPEASWRPIKSGLRKILKGGLQ